MDFSVPTKRPRGESIVPMINVVFLLLIFFLMTSHLAKPEPFEVSPPDAATEREPTAELVLFADKSAALAFEDHRGDAAITAIAAARSENAPVQLRADAEIPAVEVAKVLRLLSAVGVGQVELVVAPK